MSMAGSMQLKISVLTFSPYQSLKVNTKLLIRTNTKSRLRETAHRRSVLHQQLRSPLSWSTHALVFKGHAQKKGYRKQPLRLHLCYESPLGFVFGANENIPVSYQTTLRKSPNLEFLPQKTNKTLGKGLPDISKAATTHNACWDPGAQAEALWLQHLTSQGTQIILNPTKDIPELQKWLHVTHLPGMFPNFWALFPHQAF